ncbi:MAG: RES domain-containing protein [Mesorhizobium sp.]
MRFTGTLYRALNPVYAREPLSGRGAELFGGRFNPKGVAALYTSLTVLTALREANQVGTLQPTTLVSYEADIRVVFDCRQADALAEFGMDEATLGDAGWRNQMKTAGEAKTQAFARALIERGFHAMLVRSFARATGAADLNLVIWSWNGASASRLSVIDDEGRLSR